MGWMLQVSVEQSHTCNIVTLLHSFVFHWLFSWSTDVVRLVNGENKCSGRVEVLRHDQWGTVCDLGWDVREAHVVCLQLGCGFAEHALHGAAFGPGKGEIWLRHVQCTGHESSLTHCAVVLHNYYYCTHENDAGVKCSGKRFCVSFFFLAQIQILKRDHLENVNIRTDL